MQKKDKKSLLEIFRICYGDREILITMEILRLLHKKKGILDYDFKALVMEKIYERFLVDKND